MKKNNWYKQDKLKEKYISEITRYYKCGHSVQFKNLVPYIFCSHCGKMILEIINVNMIIKLKGDFQNETTSKISCK